MKYCNTCGNLNRNKARKCSNCGTLVNRNVVSENEYGKNYSTQEDFKPSAKAYKDFKTIYVSQKKNLLYLFPFFLIPGIGIIYAGNWKRGLYFLLAFIVTTIFDVVFKVRGSFFVIGITTPAYIILIVWGIIAAIKEIRLYNEKVENQPQKGQQMKSVDKAIFQ